MTHSKLQEPTFKFQGDMLNFSDFIQVNVFTTNHHLKVFQMATEIQARNEGKCGSGDIIRKRRMPELLFLHATLGIDLFSNPA